MTDELLIRNTTGLATGARQGLRAGATQATSEALNPKAANEAVRARCDMSD